MRRVAIRATMRARYRRLNRSARFRVRRRERRRGHPVHLWRSSRVKALVKSSAAPGFVLKNVPEPIIRDDEVLIRVRRAGVCGTDVHIYDWDAWAQGRIKPPIIVGHEFAGEVVKVAAWSRMYAKAIE